MSLIKRAFDYAIYQAALKVLLPCKHEAPRLRCYLDTRGRARVYQQCSCGKKLPGEIRHATLNGVNPKSLPPFSRQADELQRANVREVYVIAYELGHGGRKPDWWADYSAYLKSEEWKAKRREVFARSEGVCEKCTQSLAVHVHHLTYERAGDEELSDLQAVCLACHLDYHPERFHDDF